MENNNEVKRTQGEWVIGYGHTSNCLGIFTKKMIDEGIKDNPICLITPIENMNETDKVNAEFICKAVNEYDKLKEDNAVLLNAFKELVSSYSMYVKKTEKFIRENIL